MRKDAKIERLSQVPMFSACSRKDPGVIAKYADELSVDAGTDLIRTGET